MTLAYAVGQLQGGDPEGVAYTPHPLAALTFLIAGGAIVPRQPRNAVGWLFLGVGLITGAVAVTGTFAEARPMMWLNQWLPALAFGLLPLALLLFPNGGLPGRGWRFVLWLGLAALIAATIPLALAVWQEPRIVFDFAIRHSGGRAVAAFQIARVGLLLVVATSVLAVVSLVARRRREGGDTRQQIKLLALGAMAVPIGVVLEISKVPGSEVLVAAAIPLAAGAAVLKYRLYDIDLFVNRSLVYGVLTGLLALIYAGLATSLGSAFGSFGSPLVATGVVAVAFQPLRARVQKGVSRLLYGHRDDPYTAISQLGRILEPAMEPETLFPRLTEAIADALRLPFVAIDTVDNEGGEKPVAIRGRRLATVEEFPLMHDGRLVGRLLVSPRTEGGSFTTLERTLLQDLARQSGVALHALQLTGDLRASRARLVRSREDERLRLRRELHDGVGPALAGATMQIGVARDAGGKDRDATLDRLEAILQGCLTEIRQIVEGLRPPSLDAVGLVEAIRRNARMFSRPGGVPDIEVVTSPEVLDLPAAVEVAAYRIATEALTNSVRHSGARSCRLTLSLNGDLTIEVVDDGRGIPDGYTAGVGLTAMRERAEELGGRLSITTGKEGTRVSALLPVGTS